MNRPICADLHVHTTASDGTLDLPHVLELAEERGLEAVAITDHDRIHPDLADPIVDRGGVTVIRGIELKVQCEDGWRIDLLGYGVEVTPSLEQLIDRLQTDRQERARRMIGCLERRLNVSLALKAHPGIGRPHIARAVAAHPATEMTEQDVFDEYIADGRPCFHARDVPAFGRATEILAEAARVTALAHPLRYEDFDRALDVARMLGAVERRYPYEHPVDVDKLDRTIEQDGLLATGGSDAHDDSIGVTGLTAQEWRAFAQSLAGSSQDSTGRDAK